jgi:hypothetical protein
MAKRFYNLEKETKEYLKACEAGNIIPFASVNVVNNFCITQKNFNWSITPTQLIEYSYLPNIWLDSSISSSYPTISRNWINLTNTNSNVTLPTTVLYNNSYNGSLFLNNSESASVAWNNNGITSDFTIDSWVTFLSGTGVNTSAMFTNDVYQTRGFRSGFAPSLRRYTFWNSESVPPGTPNSFSLDTPNNSVTYSVPINLTLTFNTTTSSASIFLNGNVSVSATGRNFFPPTNSSLTFNANLNNTNHPILLHSIKVYNKALTQSQINTTFNLLRRRFNI